MKTTALLCIDPGPTHSGWVLLCDADGTWQIVDADGGMRNEMLYALIENFGEDMKGDQFVVIEDVRLYRSGSTSNTVLETVKQIGVFRYLAQQNDAQCAELPRSTILEHLYGPTRTRGKTSDARITKTMIARWPSIASKSSPVKNNHARDALAVGTWWIDKEVAV